MDHRATKLPDALERRLQIGNREVGEGGGVAGTWSAPVNAEPAALVLDLPSGPGFGGPRRELGAEHAVPEVASALGIVGRKLDQRRRQKPIILASSTLSGAARTTGRAAGCHLVAHATLL
jgi:hypothetical protein